jgi:hypothetical protein
MSDIKNENNTVEFGVLNLAEVVKPRLKLQIIDNSYLPYIEYGLDNRWPMYLVESVSKSPRHQAYINLRKNGIAGGKRGVTYSDNLKEFMENVDCNGTTFDEVLKDWARDMAILETFACMVRYSKDRKSIAAIDYLDSTKVRAKRIIQTPEQIENGEPGYIEGYYVSNDWSNLTKNPARYFPKFNPYPRNANGKPMPVQNSTELFFYHEKVNGQDYLPEVSYASALNLIEADKELTKFGLNTMHNGVFASCVVEMKATGATPEEKRRHKQNFTNELTGTENNSKMMFVISDSGDTVKVTPFNTLDPTSQLEWLQKYIGQGIDTAHRCQPAIAGVQNEGSTLGSDGKLVTTSQKQFNTNVIGPLQAPIISFIDKVLKFNGYTDYKFKIHLPELLEAPDFLLQRMYTEDIAADYGIEPEQLLPEFRTPVTSADVTQVEDTSAEAQVEDQIETI